MTFETKVDFDNQNYHFRIPQTNKKYDGYNKPNIHN